MSVATEKLLSGTLSTGARASLTNALDIVGLLTAQSSHAALLEGYYVLRNAIAERHNTPDLPNAITTPSTVESATIYNLHGQSLKEAPLATGKGIYIINNRKVVL
jgi:hypothetical protein